MRELRATPTGRMRIQVLPGFALGHFGAPLAEFNRRYPGIRFRMIDEQDNIRRHIRLFVNGAQIFDLGSSLNPSDEVCIVQALSGG